MKNKIKYFATASALLALTQASQSAVIATYDFTGGALAATTETYAGSAGDVVLGVATANAAGNLDLSADDVETNISNTGTVFSFTYTVTGLAAGETISLDSASIGYTNFGATVRVDFSESGFVTETPSNGDSTFTGDLTSTGLVNGDAVTIKFGMRDNTDTVIYALDNLELNGTVTTIPEPSSTALLGLGGLALIMRRRRA